MRSIGLPNWITLGRILLIPWIAYFYVKAHYETALILLLIAGISDFVDGGLARYWGQRTRLGTILDPAADKILMLVSFSTLAWMHKVPLWLMVFVVVRDVYIVVGVIILRATAKRFYVKPTYVSKFNTFIELLVLTLCLLIDYLQHDAALPSLQSFKPFVIKFYRVSWYLSAFFIVASTIHYTLLGIAILKGKSDLLVKDKPVVS